MLEKKIKKAIEDEAFSLARSIKTLSENMRALISENAELAHLIGLGVTVSMSLCGKNAMTAFLGDGEGIEASIENLNKDWKEAKEAKNDKGVRNEAI